MRRKSRTEIFTNSQESFGLKVGNEISHKGGRIADCEVSGPFYGDYHSATIVSGEAVVRNDCRAVKHSFDPREDVLRREAVFLAQIIHACGMFDELIGPADAHNGRRNMLLVEQFGDRAAISTRENVVLQRCFRLSQQRILRDRVAALVVRMRLEALSP